MCKLCWEATAEKRGYVKDICYLCGTGIAKTEKRKLLSSGKHAGEYVHTCCKSGNIKQADHVEWSEEGFGKYIDESDSDEEADEDGEGGMGGGN